MLDDGVSRLTWSSLKRGCRGKGRIGRAPDSSYPTRSWRGYIPPLCHPPSTLFVVVATIRDPSLRYRQSSTRNEARDAKPSLCRLACYTELLYQDNMVFFRTKYIYERVIVQLISSEIEFSNRSRLIQN